MMTVIEKQAMDAVIALNRKTKDANQIDWEQRRYEIAKDMMAAFLSNPCENIHGGGAERAATDALKFADALINALKTKQDE